MTTHTAMLSSDELYFRKTWQVDLLAFNDNKFISHNKLLNAVYTTCKHFTLSMLMFAKPDNIYTAMLSHKLHHHASLGVSHTPGPWGTHQDEQLAAMLNLTPYSGFLYAFAKHIRCML